MTSQAIKRGIIQSFDPTTYTASVLLLEATSAVLTGVPLANHSDGTSAVTGAYCAVLFFDEINTADAVILAVYPNGSGGVPSPTPGRVAFLAAPVHEVIAQVINAGITTTYTLAGPPAGALGVIYKCFFTSATVGAYIQIAPHGGTIGNYAAIGNIQIANAIVNDNGIVQLSTGEQLDIKANTGNCTVDFYSMGYVF